MHKNSLLIGLVLGFVVGLFSAGLVFRIRAAACPIQVTSMGDSSYKGLWQESAGLYVLKLRGVDFGSVTVNNEGIEQILLLDWPARQLSIRAKDGRLLGRITLEQMEPANPYTAQFSMHDEDADGVPDKKVVWNGANPTTFVRGPIEWSPKLLSTSTSPCD